MKNTKIYTKEKSNNLWIGVPCLGINSIEDAPEDDRIYIRTDGKWEPSILPNYEKVRIALYTDNNNMCKGQKVTVFENTYVYKGQPIEINVPFGVAYTVSVDNKDNYYKPTDQHFVANQPCRNIDMVYTELPVGVRILGIDNKLYQDVEWDTAWNINAAGVYIGDEKNHHLIIDLKDQPLGIWGETSVSNITTTSELNLAKQDFQGFANTSQIVSQHSSSNAAKTCYGYQFKHNTFGYLGSAGEWWLIYQNKITIDKCMLKCGGTPIDINEPYWTSTQTQDSDGGAWAINWSNGDLTKCKRDSNLHIRAFTLFK